MGDKLDKVIEGYKPMSTGRVFYPRNMNLSEDFVNAVHREYDRLVGEGQSPKNLVHRFGKAMKFHASEDRKYHKIDEENARLAAEAKVAEAALPSHGKRSHEAQLDQQDIAAGVRADAGAKANGPSGARKRKGKWGFPGKPPKGRVGSSRSTSAETVAKELEEKRNTMKFDPDSGKYHRDTGKAFGGSKRAMNQDPRPHSSYTGKKKPDEDGDGVPDWADKKPGKDDHHKSSAKGTKKHKKKHR